MQADLDARSERKSAVEMTTYASRQMSRAEADCDMLAGKVEALKLAKTRLEEETYSASDDLRDATRAIANLADLEVARDLLETIKVAVEAARMTMMTKRSMFDEIRREGELRTKRRQEIIQEVSGWRHRLTTAEKRIFELDERKKTFEAELK